MEYLFATAAIPFFGSSNCHFVKLQLFRKKEKGGTVASGRLLDLRPPQVEKM